MKFFLLIGGLCGLVLTLVASLHAGNALSYALRDASIGCCVGALIFRGLHFVVLGSIRDHVALLATRDKAQHEAGSEDRRQRHLEWQLIQRKPHGSGMGARTDACRQQGSPAGEPLQPSSHCRQMKAVGKCLSKRPECVLSVARCGARGPGFFT